MVRKADGVMVLVRSGVIAQRASTPQVDVATPDIGRGVGRVIARPGNRGRWWGFVTGGCPFASSSLRIVDAFGRPGDHPCSETLNMFRTAVPFAHSIVLCRDVHVWRPNTVRNAPGLALVVISIGLGPGTGEDVMWVSGPAGHVDPPFSDPPVGQARGIASSTVGEHFF